MEDLMNVLQAGRKLGLKPRYVIELVQEGKITAYRTMGRRVDRHAVDSTTTGLRFKPSDIQEYLDAVAVR